MKANLLNGLTLAYMGDAAYESVVRKHLIETGFTKPNQLHQLATAYVSAKAQARIIQGMLDDNLLTEQEEAVYKRGRNAKSYTKAKNVDSKTYSMSTGFEAVLGFVYLDGQTERFKELCQWSIAYVEKK